MLALANPFQSYREDVDATSRGAGDACPTAFQVLKDNGVGEGLRGKTVLITGFTSKIGMESARTFYKKSAIIFAFARNLAKMENVIQDIASKFSGTNVLPGGSSCI